MQIGFTLDRGQQKLIAGYLLIVVVVLVWEMERHLAAIEANQRRELQRRRSHGGRATVGVVGVPDRDVDEDDVEDELEEIDPEERLRELAEEDDP